MTRNFLQFQRSGRAVRIGEFSPRATALDWLRLQERSTGTKEGCAEGDCGACAVVVVRERDGRLFYEPLNSCITLLGQLDGAELITVEDLADDGVLHPVQAAMAREHGSQCGFCTPGIVMSLFAHYHECDGPTTRGKINDALAGNLCRCTGYRPIVDAALEVCNGADDQFTRNAAMRRRTIAALDDKADLLVGGERSFFAAPASEQSLARLYLQHPDATIIAGATDVGLWITKRLAPIEKIIHVGRVAELSAIEETADGYALGAIVSLARAAPVLGSIDPDIAEVLRRFGSIQVRAGGTVGGNIANGSPIGDLAPMLIALGASVELRRGEKIRRMPLESFFLDYGKQDRARGEFVRRLLVPRLPATTHFRAYKITKRFDEDISALLAAFCLKVVGGRIVDARVAFGGMAGISKRAKSVEASLNGLSLTDTQLWRTAADAVSKDLTPLTDLRASAAYRARVAGNLVIKAIAEMAGVSPGVIRIADHRMVADAAE
ncbi:MAG: xanthine dehydrogenase small subunit [Xanthobacteraceae bacterium]|jgi:xanthine dehydrogenase small subunit